MGAILTDKVPVLELLKPTGYNCPEELLDKTWGDVTKSGGGASIEENKAVSITSNGSSVISPTAGKDAMAKVTLTVDVNSKLYAWMTSNSDLCYTLSATPAIGDKVFKGTEFGEIQTTVITAVGDEYASITTVDWGECSRLASKDLTL